MANAYTKKANQEFEEKVTLAYMAALWTAQWFSKNKPKKLEQILKQKKKQMTDEDMLRQVEILNKLFGGEVN